MKQVLAFLGEHKSETFLGLTLLALVPLANCGPGGNWEPCGDGTLTPDEECDDGNTTDGDGCSSTCKLESEMPDNVGGAGAGGAGSGGTGLGGALGGMGGDSSPSTGGGDSGPTGQLMFLAPPVKAPNVGGISGADAKCAANAPDAAEYKALLVDGTNRVACTTANCSGGTSEHVDWVLTPNTTYARQDGTVVGTTNADGLFTFNLDAAIAPGATYYTGLASDWTSSADDCGDWASATGFAQEGVGDLTTSDAIAGASISCSFLAGSQILCVEQ